MEGTFYSFGEAVADLARNFALKEWWPEDSREFTRLCVEWATEFEVLHHDRVWDGEYIEEIDAFFDKKYAELEAGRVLKLRNPHLPEQTHSQP